MTNTIPLVPTIPNESKSWGKILRQLGLLSKKPGSFFLGQSEKIFEPVQHLSIGSSMWRKFTCVPDCMVCCKFQISLDFLPGESSADLESEGFQQVIITVNGEQYPIWSQMSDPFSHGNRCRYVIDLPPESGRRIGCGRWSTTAPLSCVSAPNIHVKSHGPQVTTIYKGPFGRWTMWNPQPRCQFETYPVEKIDPEEVLRDIGLLKRWQNWAEYFELDTWLPEIIEIFEDVRRGIRPPDSIRVV